MIRPLYLGYIDIDYCPNVTVNNVPIFPNYIYCLKLLSFHPLLLSHYFLYLSYLNILFYKSPIYFAFFLSTCVFLRTQKFLSFFCSQFITSAIPMFHVPIFNYLQLHYFYIIYLSLWYMCSNRNSVMMSLSCSIHIVGKLFECSFIKIIQ